jgi:hypothetical protein
MKRTCVLVAVLLVVASPVDAKPWWKDWKCWLAAIVNEGAAVASIYSASACRHANGIGPCQGGYGEIRARNAVNLFGAAGTTAIGLWGRHIGVKEWFAVPAGYTAWNTYEAVHQRLIACPSGEHFLYSTKKTCVDNYADDAWRLVLHP